MSEYGRSPSASFDTSNPAPARSGWRNLAQYIAGRGIMSLLTVVAAVYIIIIVANLGGYVDEIIEGRIENTLMGMVDSGWLSDTPPEERLVAVEEMRATLQEAAGLNRPFLLRTLTWLWDGLTLNWGKADHPGAYGTSANSASVRQIILDHISRTLFMFGAAYLVLFVLAVSMALALNRQYGRWLDKLFVLLSPLSSAPAWVYGVILSVLFLRVFTFSTGGTFDAWPEEFQLSYVPLMLKRLFLPFLAILISGLFLAVNSWRSYFLVYSSEDYVEMARAKGLSNGQIERRYVLRPALPGLLTSFALMTIVLWQEVIVLEYIFNVAGIGQVFVNALRVTDTPVIVGLAVMFAYLLALTVLLLDVAYALVDPRVKVGKQELSGSLAGERRLGNGRFHLRRPRLSFSLPHGSLRSLATAVGHQAQAVWQVVRQLAGYPTAVFGLIVIALFTAVSIYTVIAIPYDEAIATWRGDDDVWARNPKDAQPAWVNFFRRDKLPETIVLNSSDPIANKQVTVLSEGQTEITFTFPFDYPYSDFPQEMAVYFSAQFQEKLPFVTLTWINPLGQEKEVTSLSLEDGASFYFSRDKRLQRRLRSDFPQKALFVDLEAGEEETAVILQGPYQLQINALVFEPDANVDAEFVLFGQVHGLAGTDSNRRDLSLALLWGTPVALAFGLAAALVTSFASMVLAAVGAWYGGWVDRLVQFFTEINLLLPFLAVSLMIYTLYSRSILAILGVTILLNIFSHSIKTYRAIFLQIKESPYIEAARAYGASDRRLVVRYLMPRVLPILLPKLILLVPSFVFLEATLAYLGVSDPLLPTWGKLVVDALSSGVYRQAYHLVLAPFILLFLVGFAFALVGLALERIFDPRLREI